MDDRKDEPEFLSQVEEEAQQSKRIGSSGNGHADAVAGCQQLVLADMVEKLLRQRGHMDMVQPCGQLYGSNRIGNGLRMWAVPPCPDEGGGLT